MFLLVPAYPGSPGQKAVAANIYIHTQTQPLTALCPGLDRIEGPRPRGRPKRTWREVVREDCQARKLNKEDAMDRCKWRKMIKDVR